MHILVELLVGGFFTLFTSTAPPVTFATRISVMERKVVLSKGLEFMAPCIPQSRLVFCCQWCIQFICLAAQRFPTLSTLMLSVIYMIKLRVVG